MSKKKIFVIDDSVNGGEPVPVPTPSQEKTVTLSANNTQVNVVPDSGYLLSKVIAKAQITTEHKVVTTPITVNGTYSFTPTDSAHPMDSISIPVNVSGGGGDNPIEDIFYSLITETGITVDGTELPHSTTYPGIYFEYKGPGFYWIIHPLLSTYHSARSAMAYGWIDLEGRYATTDGVRVILQKGNTPGTVAGIYFKPTAGGHYMYMDGTNTQTFETGVQYIAGYLPASAIFGTTSALTAIRNQLAIESAKVKEENIAIRFDDEGGKFAELPVEEVDK